MFRFEHPELGIDDNVRLAAREQFDQAIAEVSETGFEVHATVRNVRRRLKRVRAILRLIRPVFADYAAENAALRDIGSAYSGLRDAMACVEAVDVLSQRAGDDLAASLGRIRQAMASVAATREAELDREAFLQALRGELRDSRVRSELWEFNGTGRRAMVPGLVATYRRARRTFQQAGSRRDEESLHEWRKAVKHHAAQLSLLSGLIPAFAAGRGQGAKKLTRVLGDLQNLHVLGEALEGNSLGLEDADKSRLAPHLAGEIERIGRRALRLGAPLFSERSRVVRERWRTYWADWQAVRRLG